MDLTLAGVEQTREGFWENKGQAARDTQVENIG
jgi:hypothetical protein